MSLNEAVTAGPNGTRATGADPETRAVDVDDLIAEYDEERPQRRLGERLDSVVTLYCFAISAFVLLQVFAPLRQGNQFFLMLFLGLVLPLVFLTYRGRKRAPGDRGPSDDPHVHDWLLALVALVVCLYPVLPVAMGDSGGGFNAFLDRQGQLTPTDVAMGTLLTLLVLEGCRRTTGLVLPIVCAVFFAYA